MSNKTILGFLSIILISLVFIVLLKYLQDVAKKDIFRNNFEQEELQKNEKQKLIVGSKFPDISLKDLDGNQVSLEDFNGKIVLLNFWTTWCIYCDKEMPDLQELYDKNKNELVVLAVNVGETKEVVQNYIDENKYTFPILLDEEESLPPKFQIGGFPTTFFIDKEGNLVGFTNQNGGLVDRVPGMMTKEQMELLLNEIRVMEKVQSNP